MGSKKLEVRGRKDEVRITKYEVLVPSDVVSCSLLQPVKKMIFGVPYFLCSGKVQVWIVGGKRESWSGSGSYADESRES